ncbi:MAG TPA: hypothetical protein EYQ23_00930 [Verrucomicrobiales bacterium]|nr:hypothetical protein [Verrucomicrobiales bacterium]
MKIVTLSTCIFWLLIIVMPRIAGSQTNEVPPIRAFDLKIIENLGQSIHQRDIYAARATDILFKAVGKPEKLEEEKIGGWIVREHRGNILVRFLKQVDDGFLPAYDITFISPDKGILTKATGRLSPDELAQFKARQLALKNIPEFCSPRYNTVVLQDVDGKGFLVYALAATTDPDLVFVGGHYRMTVSPDGTKVEQVDRLFKSCLVLRKSDVPKDSNVAGLSPHMS